MRRALLIALCAAAVAIPATTIRAQQQPYRALDGWMDLPRGFALGEVSAIAVDIGDRIFAFQRGTPPVVEFDPSGRVVKTWGAGQFVYPHGLRIDRHGFLWITDGRAANGKGQQVFKYTREGQRILSLGRAGVSGDGPDTFNGPTDVAVAASGEIFVADGHVNSRIVKFTKDGRFIKAWGKKGSGPSEFDVPHTLFFDSQGRLLVGDLGNRRIQVFDQEGTFITQWTHLGAPSGIYVTPDDTLYVADNSDQRRVLVGSAVDGSLKYTLNDLTLAEGITVDRMGSIYVSETAPGRTAGGLATGHMVRKLVKN